MRYRIEIYAPGNLDYDVIYSLESKSPFKPCNTGILSIRAPGDPTPIRVPLRTSFKAACVLRVRNLEHIIFDCGDELMHSIGVLTEALEDIAASRG